MRKHRKLTLSTFGVILSGAVTAADGVPDGFDRLLGAWQCEGHFMANNQSIASTIVFSYDAASNGLIVRHDDKIPASYHALEVWSAGKSNGFRAAITDAYSGMRWFGSSGWNENSLVWSRPTDGLAVEQFAYTLKSTGELQIDWLTARKDGTLAVGDTLLCRKQN